MSEVREQLTTTLRRLVVATVGLYVVIILLIGFVWFDGANRSEDIARVATSTNHALCVLRTDLERRVSDSITFLADHPNGIPGISAETIQQSITNQQRTIDALADLEC